MKSRTFLSGKIGAWLVLFFCVMSAAKQARADIDPDLDSRLWDLTYKGRYSEAMTLALQCERDAAGKYGSEHPDVASCLYWQATVQHDQTNYDEALALSQRELAINEKAFGPEDENVAVSLENVAYTLQALKNIPEARHYYQRALAIYEKLSIPAKNKKYFGPKIASTLRSLAEFLVLESRFREAAVLYERALLLYKKDPGPLGKGKDEVEVLDALAGVYEKMGELGKSQKLQNQAMQITDQNLGNDPLDVAAGAKGLAKRYQAQGLYARAEPLWLKSLKIMTDQFGTKAASVLKATSDLAGFYSQTLQFAKAQALYEGILAVRESERGKAHPEVAITLSNLALMYDKQGLYAKAEPLYLRAIAIFEKSPGQRVPLLSALNGLGLMYMHQGRLAQAELFLKRTLTIAETTFAEGEPKLAISLYNLATVYQLQKNYDASERMLKRALANAEKFRPTGIVNMATAMQELYVEQNDFAQADPMLQYILGADENFLGKEHPLYGAFQKSLASLYVKQGRYSEAGPLFGSAVRIFEKPLGLANPAIASVLSEWAKLHVAQQRFSDAELLQLRALSIMENALGREHPELATYLSDLANVYLMQDKMDEALLASKRACDLLRHRYTEGGTDKFAGSRLSEQTSRRDIFLQRLHLLSRRQTMPSVPPALVNESFEVAQLARASSVGQSVAQMAARFAAGGDELALLIREQQDTLSKLAQADQGLLAILSRPVEQGQQGAAGELRDEIDRLNQLSDLQNRQLSEKFPDYRNLVNQAPVTASQVQALLSAEEAMLVYSVTAQGSYAWVIKKHQVQFLALPIAQAELETQVRFVRSKLQPDANKRLPEFTPLTSNRLYQSVFAPLETGLADVKHILLVNEAALQSVPFGLLGSSGTASTPQWLAQRFSFSVLPSVNALKALRVFSRRNPGSKPFAGFGDPALNDRPVAGSDINAGLLFRSGNFQASDAGMSGIADVEAIRKADSLPQTAIELQAIARALNASNDDVYLRERATETRVKSLDLSPYRFIAFATHGVIAGEMPGLAEPGLILTPPSTGNAADDGYLSSSEIAQLKLNADWVVLSACNTASVDGSGSGEGLSGLAKAFFFAGSRSLLVSNWPVDSLATQQLITRTMGFYSDIPDIEKSAALQKAMLEMMASDQYSHPFYWAPFSVVGE